MTVIKTKHGFIYRADINKSVRYKGSNRLYSEILSLKETDQIEEVEDNNNE